MSREAIRAAIARLPLIPLGDPTPASRDAVQTKAGVVPLRVERGELLFYVMKPVARHPDLPPPPFQICKGTRMVETAFGWHDVGKSFAADRAESLLATALREGIEEIGLVLSNMIQLFDAGEYSFRSAKKGNEKDFRLYAAIVADPGAFTQPDPHASATADRQWLTLSAFEQEGRADHLLILQDLARRLKDCDSFVIQASK